MDPTERRNVLERLSELEGWTEYILEALHMNQRSEPVNREMLERTIEKHRLRQLREQAWSLRDHFHRLTTELELSHPIEGATV